MSTTVFKLKKSSVASRVPTDSDLDYGELAINYTDGNLYYKNSSNVIKTFSDSDGVQSQIDASIIAAGSYNDASVDAHLNQSTAASGEVLSWNGSDYDWIAAGGAGDLLAANNLSDLDNASTSRTNLGVAIGSDVQAHSSVLDGTTASFTTAEESKLAGIEASADVTDTANVTAAGALMDSEVTNLAQVKAFNSADYATAAQGATADAALPRTGGAMTGAITTNSTFDGRDVAADGAKLDGIDTNATAYGDSDVDTHLNTSTAASGEVLSWNGSDYDWIAASSGGLDSAATLSLTKLNHPDASSLGLGTNALLSDDGTTNCNVAIGHSALTSSVTGQKNVVVGHSALCSISTGIGNVVLGQNAGSKLSGSNGSNYNVILGSCAMGSSCGAGIGHVAIGYYALHNIGSYASNSVHTNNISIGMYSMQNTTTGYGSMAVGHGSLRNNTSGTHNTAIGMYGSRNNTTGISNTAVGSSALKNNTTGSCNTAIGHEAGCTLTSGSNNIILGRGAAPSAVSVSNEITLGDTNITTFRIPGLQSGASSGHVMCYNGTSLVLAAASGGGGLDSAATLSLTKLNFPDGTSIGLGDGALATDDGSSNNNVGIGTAALCTVSTGCYNLGLGIGAGCKLTTGNYNTFIGMQAGCSFTTQHCNIGIGSCTLALNNNGTNNVAVGIDALRSTAGSYNVALGFCAGGAAYSGDQRVFIGRSAGQRNYGGYNIGIGDTALCGNGSASSLSCHNIAIGSRSNVRIEQGQHNISLGECSLFNNTNGNQNLSIGRLSLKANISGCYNIAVGVNAGCLITTGGANVAVGTYAGNTITTGCSNIVLGYNAQASAATVSNEITIGDANITSFRIPGLQSGATHGQVLAFDSAGGDIAFTTVAGGGGLDSAATLSLTKLNHPDASSLGLGTNALANDDGTSNNNTALGYESGFTNQSCSNMTSIGYQAARFSTKNGLVAIGMRAAYACAGAYGGVAIGWCALSHGQGNGAIAIGMNAGQKMTGQGNMAIGRDAMRDNVVTGIYNHAIGYGSAQKMSSGDRNTAFGHFTLKNTTLGQRNVVVGAYGMNANTTGVCNTAIGYNSLRNNTIGFDNAALGAAALCGNTTGRCNTAVGKFAIQQNQVGCNNVAVGAGALRFVTAGNNTALGFAAGNTITTGSNNITLGYNAQATSATTSNEITIGDANITTFRIPALSYSIDSTGEVSAVNFNTTSDVNLKENIERINNGIDIINSINPVSFNWKSSGKKSYGVIAQEIEQLIPEAVSTNIEGNKHVNYTQIIAFLVDAVQDQQQQIDELKSKIQ